MPLSLRAITKAVKIISAVVFLLIPFSLQAQQILTIEGQTFTNSDEIWLGVNIPREEPTILVFRNNRITSSNNTGYMLQAGDEDESALNNNLDGASITGNMFIWKGTDMESITHAIFTGHNSNVTIKYNYLDMTPMGIIRKSSTNMSNTGGGVAYNIVKGGAVGMVIKGMSNVNVFNNTFYTNRTTSQTWRPLLHIYTNVDDGGYSVAHGTKIHNNIFYTVNQTFAISIDDHESLNGLECDYNVYWCEKGKPRFNINGTVKSFAQWQAMGYDRHSHVFNPKFKDFVSFVPANRLDFGKDLGAEWSEGLSPDAEWGTADPRLSVQNGKWQVGAIVFGDSVVSGKDDIFISPNPAQEHINISNLNLDTGSHSIRIFDLAGKLRHEFILNPGDNNQIQINLEPGVYIFQILFETSTKFAQKFVVIR